MQEDTITVALGLPELRVLGCDERWDHLWVEVRYRWEQALCPGCGRQTAKVHATTRQRKRDWRLWGKAVFLVLHKRRFRCLCCGAVFSEPDPVFGPRRRTTQRLREEVGRAAVVEPCSWVAKRQGVSPSLVRRSLVEVLQEALARREPGPPPRVVGLDAFSLGSGRKLATAVWDLEGCYCLGLALGQRQHDLEALFTPWAAPEGVEAVVMDMAEAFRQAVATSLPWAQVVVDKFHVISLLTRALSQVLAHCLTQLPPGCRGELARLRPLLLRGRERLTLAQEPRLLNLLPHYPAVAQAWQLKEALRTWYRTATPATAAAWLAQWEQEVRDSGLAEFKPVLTTLRRWRQEWLNYFRYPHTNALVEGKNTRIKLMKRLAYGCRNLEVFRQRILIANGYRDPSQLLT